jgi:uncharacterized protein (DUF4415 family)
MSANKEFTESAWIDPDDAPELTEEDFARGDVYHGGKLISRGIRDSSRPGRPLGSGSKTPITVRFDTEIIEAFRTRGKGWQTQMNDALREWLQAH